MSDDVIRLRLEEVEADYEVQLDWSRLSWRDVLDFNRASETLTAEEQQELIAELVTKLAGRDALDMPALVAMTLARHVIDRLTGKGPSAKNA